MNNTFAPAYLSLLESGELAARARKAISHLAACDLCAWECGINRVDGQMGVCKTTHRAKVSTFFPHMGEEDPLRGRKGSGTIFFSNCNLRCQYCQNFDISQLGEGRICDTEEIAGMMMALQHMGCHNINLVSPSHVVAQILEALVLAAHSGLRLPLVYNTGGYDSPAALALLDGIVDIYMPDIKYSDSTIARRYSKIPHYARRNRAAIKEMHRQVGDLVMDDHGIAQRGLLVRHLVLPEDLAGTASTMQFLAGKISKDTYINIMGQYRPEYKVQRENIVPLNRPVTVEEMAEAYRVAKEAGLHRFDQRQRPAWSLF